MQDLCTSKKVIINVSCFVLSGYQQQGYGRFYSYTMYIMQNKSFVIHIKYTHIHLEVDHLTFSTFCLRVYSKPSLQYATNIS